jgi:hypothetical protein
MKIFVSLIKIFWPTILITIVFFFFLKISNEIYDFKSTIELQTEDVLYGIAFSDKTYEYKLYNLLTTSPELAIIGTSRVLQFNADMFPDYSFYNAGLILRNIGQFKPLLEKLIEEEKKPQIMIIGLDQNFFNQEWNLVNSSDNESYRSRLDSIPNIVIPDKSILLEAILNEPSLLTNKSILTSKNIGLMAKAFNQGFRVDGSYYYGRYYEFEINHDLDFSDTIFEIENNASRFRYADDFSLESIIELESFLEFAHNNGITIVGFMPPFAPTINEVMSFTGKYEYIEKVTYELNRLFKRFDYKYFDFTIMDDTNDSLYIDGFHGGEEVYELIAIEINASLE